MKSYNAFLDEFLSTIINTFDTDKIYDKMMSSFCELLHPTGLLLTINRETRHTYHVTRCLGDISYEKNETTLCDSMMHYLFSKDGFILINENAQILSLLTPKQRRWMIEQHISMLIPIKYQHALIGFLFVAAGDNAPYNEDKLFFVQKMCYYSAFVLRNANLYQNAYRASITDDLTSLYNRKHAFDYIANCYLSQKPITLILLDIDDFKLYNELYGSKEADNLLRLCSHTILEEIDSDDMGFRYGADEFLIATSGCDTQKAANLARRIVDKIISNNTSDIVWNITITCGISTYPEISADADSLIHDAVQAVYFGKLHRKGSLTVYQSNLENSADNIDSHTAYDRVAPTIYALTAAIDAKDNFTFIHSVNVAKYAVALGEALGLNDDTLELIRHAALLHDIGKISIPEHILKKRSRLTSEEYEIMKTHVENSTKMIRYLPNMDYVIPAVVGHHERYDGKGYPRGLAGEDIPYLARILTIADCFDAMTGKRSYKPPMPVSYAISELKYNSGSQFDPVMTETFLELIDNGKVTV